MSLKNQLCHKCQCVFVDYPKCRGKYTCRLCISDGRRKCHAKKKLGPVWFNRDQKIQYDIPMELQNITLGEQLLIQKYSPYIPVVHIKHGTLGVHGHCISFPKDMADICVSLPRVDCEVIRYIRHYGNKDGGALSKYHGFLIRKTKVMKALYFLKMHNPLYANVHIDIANLSWMGDSDEAELNNIIDIDDYQQFTQLDSKDITTVASIQTNPSSNFDDSSNSVIVMEHNGDVVEKVKVHHTEDAKLTIAELVKAVKKSGKVIHSMEFPQIKEEALDEYSGVALFAGASPWLFPGGVGDVVDDSGEDTQKNHTWLERLIRYQDSRFEIDKMFSFYANDYCQRKLANNNAGFFVKCVCGKIPPSLQHLKEDIEENDFSFINKLLYFSGALKGTDSYWRRKKEELNEWMLYHIEQKHGPPTFFITLSCAELWWPDLQRLMAERLMFTGQNHFKRLAEKVLSGDVNSSMKAVNYLTGLVQEFF